MSVIDNIRLTFLYIEFYSMGKTWVYPESYIPYNIFRYIVKGKAEFCIDGEEIIVKENQIVYIPQGCRMSCRALSEKMAEMVELSKQRFSSLFKANMGKSPMEYVREIRLTTAARALLVSNKNINDIAYECGYEDANYFIREFKSAFGFTPNQYRKIARE